MGRLGPAPSFFQRKAPLRSAGIRSGRRPGLAAERGAIVKAHTPEKKPYTISACTIARNEAKNIARSIRSYRDFVDEIVVVDTGSTDDTARIARETGARVVSFEWQGDFAAARNFALDQVSGDWAVFLDADEYFSPHAGPQVRRCIDIARRGGQNLIGCKWLNLDADNPDRRLPAGFVIRILKAGVRYRYRIHEEAVPAEGKKILFAEKRRFFLYHTGYSSSAIRGKAERNLPLLLQEMEEETDDQRRQVDYSYLSDCYYTLGEYEKCRDASETFIRFSRQKGVVLLGNAAKPYLNLLTALGRLDSPLEEQAKWAGEFETAFPNFPDARMVSGRLALLQRRLLTAERKLRETLRAAADYTDAEACQVASVPEECHFTLGQALARQGRVSDAMLSFFQAWRLQHAYGEAVDALLGLVRLTPESSQDEFVRKMFDNPDMTRRRTVLWGLMRRYMTRQLAECYSRFQVESGRKDAGLDGQILACLAAGKGNYSGASRLFAAMAAARKNDRRMAMQALLCACLAGEASPEKMDAAQPALAVALGLRQGEIRAGDLAAVAEMVAEAGRLCGPERAAGLAGDAAGRMPPALWRDFARRLENTEEFSGALRVVEQMKPGGETAFLIGYYAMQLHRPGEAALALDAAAYVRWDDPALEECRAILKKGRRAAPVPARAVEWMQAGAFGRALPLLLRAVEQSGPDRELCSMLSICYLQAGRPHMALLAAQAGLRLNAEYADLLVNAGDARRALRDPAAAAKDYEKAARRCADPALREDLTRQARQLLSAERTAG